MPVKLYTKKVLQVQAIQWTGENLREVSAFAGPKAFLGFEGDRNYDRHALYVQTLEGLLVCPLNSWIVKGVKGEFYPVDPEIFPILYEEAS